MNRTCASICSGGGLADIGLKQAGYTPIWAVEYDADIAAVYSANHGPHVIVADIRAVDWTTLQAPTLLWASPPCPNFSVAKTGRGETETDLDMARAVVRALETLRPAKFILENVEGYAGSQSFRLIRAALDELDYWSDAEVVNAADLQVPQTRRRLILRARAGGWMQPDRPWPAPKPWKGWYAAIEDLIPTLPDSAFAPWQLKRLPGEIRESIATSGDMGNPAGAGERVLAYVTAGEPFASVTASAYKRQPVALIVGAGGYDGNIVQAPAEAPMFTVTANSNQGDQLRALLVGDGDTWRPVVTDVSPSPTVSAANGARAVLVSNLKHTINAAATRSVAAEPATTVTAGYRPNWADRGIVAGRVVAMTPRALARFMGVPDDYELPAKKSLACKVLGNGVPPEVARVAALSLETL